MTKEVRQSQLDAQRKQILFKTQQDLSGQFFYCHSCSRKTCTGHCNVSSKERKQNTLCAIAYNLSYSNKEK